MVSDSESSDSESGEIISEHLKETAKSLALNLLPEKSKRLYTVAYNTFKSWRKVNGTNSFGEEVLLCYFAELAKKYAPSSLWATYSMLRSTIKSYDNIDISMHSKLLAFLKKNSKNFQPKKSRTFTNEEITKFLTEASDDIYLSSKVALIFGISGALRRKELTDLKVKDVIVISEEELYVNIHKTKNNKPRSFTIRGDFVAVCKKYIEARPKSCPSDRFFLHYWNGRCTEQPMGINKFGSLPKEVANFLKLPNASEYTGHSLRRTSATLLVDAGADITTLKRHGGWRPDSVAEGYVGESMSNKRQIFDKISNGITCAEIPKIDSVGKLEENQSDRLDTNEGSNVGISSVEESDQKAKSKLIVQEQRALQENAKPEHKFQIFYDPAIGLYIYEHELGEAKNFVFHNCEISIDSGIYNYFTFSNYQVNNRNKE